MKKSNLGKLYSLPLSSWLLAFFVIPLIIIFVSTFLKKGVYGGLTGTFTLENFTIFKERYFFKALFKTTYVSALITIFTVLLALPTAYFIARSKHKKEFLLLIIIPFWTNFLIRIYAWKDILGTEGFLNTMLINLGIINTPLQLLNNIPAVIIVTVYTNLPFAILPLYAVIEKFDFSVVEAARDLGATNGQSFFKVFIPNIKHGIITATIFTFIPSLGSYAVPELIGGISTSNLLGKLVAHEVNTMRNWPRASAVSLALILVTSVVIIVFMKFDKKEVKEVVLEDE